jgi:alpha-L-rhamnosidase
MRRAAGAPSRRAGLVLALVVANALTALTALAVVSPAMAVTPVSLAGASWIWYPEGNPAQSAPAETRYLRRSFSVPSGAVSDAQFVVTGDDTVDVWLNGVPLAGSPRVTDSWKQALYVDLASVLRTGANTLAVASRNVAGSAGVIGRVYVATGGGSVDLVTDGGWKAAQTVTEDWTDPGYPDTGWPAAMVIGPYGVAPWLSNVSPPDPSLAAPLAVVAVTTERRRPDRHRRPDPTVRLDADVGQPRADPGAGTR